ncbi:hypothetical protein [uncultured Kriegella sp.]
MAGVTIIGKNGLDMEIVVDHIGYPHLRISVVLKCERTLLYGKEGADQN